MYSMYMYISAYSMTFCIYTYMYMNMEKYMHTHIYINLEKISRKTQWDKEWVKKDKNFKNKVMK